MAELVVATEMAQPKKPITLITWPLTEKKKKKFADPQSRQKLF